MQVAVLAPRSQAASLPGSRLRPHRTQLAGYLSRIVPTLTQPVSARNASQHTPLREVGIAQNLKLASWRTCQEADSGRPLGGCPFA
jgi:hypothetical protein